MKAVPFQRLSACVVLFLLPLCAGAFDQAHSRYARVLKQYVSDGRVHYAGLKTNAVDLRAYLDEVAMVGESEFKQWSRSEQLALLINLYNAATLQLIIEHYPVSSIRKIGGFFSSPWKLPVVRLWGKRHSLDWLEHEVIRPRYQDPRVHFALVCAARGCPPLRTEPYLAAQLDAQLDEQARAFLAQREKNRFDAASNTLHLSPIFKWYRDDFISKDRSLVAFLRPYFKAAGVLLPDEPGISFTEYDWSLNDRRAPTR